jgi:hypothetical protein
VPATWKEHAGDRWGPCVCVWDAREMRCRADEQLTAAIDVMKCFQNEGVEPGFGWEWWQALPEEGCTKGTKGNTQHRARSCLLGCFYRSAHSKSSMAVRYTSTAPSAADSLGLAFALTL